MHQESLTGPAPLVRAAPRRRLPVWVWLLAAGLIAAVSIAAVRLARVVEEINRPMPAPPLPSIDLFPHFFDATPLTVTTTVGWLKIRLTVPRNEFLLDPTIWRRMHFEDWDRLPADVRKIALQRMLYPYWYVIPWRRQWARMTANDWDGIPQPVQAMASLGMIEYWVDFYEVGRSFDLPRREVLRTVQAIAMSESWFDHRAEFRYLDGELDIGLAGASPFARRTIRRWYDHGLADFTFTDDEYSNPWHASRFLAFWFGVMLEESGGDLELAVRAYNTGIDSAKAGAGEDYLRTVLRRRARYLEGRPGHSPTWRFLLQERQTLVAAAAVARRSHPLPPVVFSSQAPVTGADARARFGLHGSVDRSVKRELRCSDRSRESSPAP